MPDAVQEIARLPGHAHDQFVSALVYDGPVLRDVAEEDAGLVDRHGEEATGDAARIVGLLSLQLEDQAGVVEVIGLR